jgi:hypothetical protein
MTSQKLVEECEKLFLKYNMSAVVIVMDSENGYYGLTLPKDSLFQWNDDASKVKLSLTDATQEQIDNEFLTLKKLDTMMDYCGQALVSLVNLLREATTPLQGNSNGIDKKHLN